MSKDGEVIAGPKQIRENGSPAKSAPKLYVEESEGAGDRDRGGIKNNDPSPGLSPSRNEFLTLDTSWGAAPGSPILLSNSNDNSNDDYGNGNDNSNDNNDNDDSRLGIAETFGHNINHSHNVIDRISVADASGSGGGGRGVEESKIGSAGGTAHRNSSSNDKRSSKKNSSSDSNSNKNKSKNFKSGKDKNRDKEKDKKEKEDDGLFTPYTPIPTKNHEFPTADEVARESIIRAREAVR